MSTIVVHKIRLRPGVNPSHFEAWVRDRDYATCPELLSLKRFSVQRASSPSGGSHYFEVIEVTSWEAFERDMQTPAFGRLVREFTELAEVVDETTGQLIEPGYSAAAAR